jgi:hypothetical protein
MKSQAAYVKTYIAEVPAERRAAIKKLQGVATVQQPTVGETPPPFERAERRKTRT